MRKCISILLIVLILITGGYFSFQYILMVTADKSWIQDFGYQQEEIYDLSLDRLGCPAIPVSIEGHTFPFTFDTGCSSGFLLTSLLEGKIDYTLVGQTEQLNRDGSHRGWSKAVLLKEFTVFGNKHTNIETTLADWEMFSSAKFNGLIGLKYFSSQVVTLDYTGRKIAVTNRPIDYSKLDTEKYVILPLHQSEQDGLGNHLFFEATLNDAPITVYLDTGKNHSYLHHELSDFRPSAGKPSAPKRNAAILLGDMELPLNGLIEANLAQVDDLPYPIAIELNSDQIQKNNLLITIDMITRHIVFRRLEDNMR